MIKAMSASSIEISMPPEWWARAEARMAEADPSFAHRPAQAQAAGLIDRAIRSRTHAALDLPTGSGKSMLSLAAAEQAKGRTVISTATKSLQAQLRDKDIPALQAAGILTRDIVVLEGRGNYACLNRAVHELDKLQPAGKKVARMVTKHLRKTPELARRDQIPVAIPDWLWSRIASDSDACGALSCRTGTSCAYTLLRDRARTADIVITNHSLLLADASIKAGDPVNWGKAPPQEGETVKPAVLGPYQHLIVDEAHALEAAAENHGEHAVSIRGIQALMTRVSKREMSGAAVKYLAICLDDLQSAMLGLPLDALLTPTGKDDPILSPAAEAARDAGKSLRSGHATFEGDVATELLVSACYALARRLDAIDIALRTGRDELGPRAVSVESSSANGRSLGISASPLAGRGGGYSLGATGMRSQLVDAGPWLIKNLWSMVPTIAMSGTLAIPGRRDWVPTRIGLNAKVDALPTSFDLRRQRLVYITPRVEMRGAESMARATDGDVKELEELIEATDGRALVLFPANVDLRFVHDRLKISHTLLGQGVTADGKSAKGETIRMSNSELARRFTEDTSSVLLATRSFMEGQDFPGETASLVVIVRFPNLRPDDPLTLARRRQIEDRGGSAWTEYAEPSMQLIFRQACGRAIRRIDDKGVVAVLDPRCRTKGYAKTALRSLAPSDYTDSLLTVREFLA